MRVRLALTGAWAFLFAFLYCPFLFAETGDTIKIKDSLFSVDFVDDLHGWAVGYYGRIMYTADGGASWALQESGTQKPLSGVDFVDRSHGWVVGYGPTILHTSDGGKTWAVQKTEEDIFYLTAVVFIDAQNGWAIGDWGTIIHTSDGGTTWKAQFSGDDAILYDIDFADDQHGWAVGEFGTIFYTEDGGTTWRKQVSKVVNVFFSCKAIDAQHVWVVGIDSIVLHTQDGGTTWNKVDTGFKKVVPFYDISFCDNETGVICGQGFVMGTSDGGVSWKIGEVDNSLQYIWLHDVACTSDAIWMVGEHGKVFRSKDNGKAWEEVAY